ncbi:MAG: cytochrome c oxidase accessory protein CcoG [Paraglaciecola sp.]|uniref:cytochrome c oxidase accessory protein CcoG n=1 Tax=Paraglaciecola sp. TaxID=1920173 RepID=UPI00273D9127|nr:cytochrome c oxidase accessory protein CcoG [Paraglaciecola sp.]MDP5032037.1 cytochrome c oxidase accessory protein CcoG [Paraglaciecola sp.]MDP5131921.1 cytochrome c oxidase accessory protein CcoG [Paraglaciecola sp.]
MSERIPVKVISPVKVHKPDSSQHDNHYTPRSRIYVRAVSGTLENFRRFFGLIFLSVFAILPWIQYDGHQAILLDIGSQRFNIFGLTLWPQDLTLLAWIFIVAAFALFFITTFAGRVWCGFMCPQTTWTFIYIWFEELIEGSRHQRIKLDERAMNFDKFWRKALKHLSWVAVALLTSLLFVGYFTPIDQLFIEFFTFSSSAWTVGFVLFFTFCTYGNAGWMREIMCTHICPYARFQSAMFDKDTFTVAYDATRGEQRGPRSRKTTREANQEKGLGDCIDCNLCVQVCPTGIDIRNGLQYECINCGACVDACNGVMEKMNYPKGLISFTSETELAGGTTKIIRPKLVGYALVLVLMSGLLVFEIMTRVPLEVDIIRDRNSLYRETNDGLIENVYTLKILNKSQQKQTYLISIVGLEGAKFIGENTVVVDGGEVLTWPISLAIDPYKIEQDVTEFEVKVEVINDPLIDVKVQEPSNFLYPDN